MVLVIFLLSLCPILSAGSEDTGVLVAAEGFSLDRSEVEEEAASKLKELDLENLRFPARMEMRRHDAMAEAMDKLAAQKLLSLEAESRGLSVDELTEKEIKALILPLTEEELEKLYELNKSHLEGTREEQLEQIRKYMAGQREKELRQKFVEQLSLKYRVKKLLPPVRFEVGASGHPGFGPEDAPITIVEFSDFGCPHCAKAGEELHRLYQEFEGKIRIVFRQYPLWMIHPQSPKAAEASLCAADQGKFWEMHNLLFAEQDRLDLEGLKDKAGRLDLDREEFDKCLSSGRHAGAVEQDLIDGSKAGVNGTPAFFINGRPFEGRFSYENIRGEVLDELEIIERNKTAAPVTSAP